MTLPKRPPLSDPIPNADIPNAPQQYVVKAPYWDAIVSGDLLVTDEGALAVDGATGGGNPDVSVQGAWWGMPLGNGLFVGVDGSITTEGPSPYIYCTPAYPQLPPTTPPYGCNTEVNTAGVTDFTEAWYDCQELTEFPCVDTSLGIDFQDTWSYCYGLTSFPSLNMSSGENFSHTWISCTGLTSFPSLDLSSGTNFSYAWNNCSSLTSFPEGIDLSSGTNFEVAWYACYSLTSFPGIDLSSGTNFSGTWANCSSLTSFPEGIDLSSGTNFNYAWQVCTSLTSFPETLDLSSSASFFRTWRFCYSLTSFPAGMFDTCQATDFTQAWTECALNQTSVNNILVSINTAGKSNGTLGLNGGSNSAPGAAGLAAKAALQSRGWTVTTN